MTVDDLNRLVAVFAATVVVAAIVLVAGMAWAFRRFGHLSLLASWGAPLVLLGGAIFGRLVLVDDHDKIVFHLLAAYLAGLGLTMITIGSLQARLQEQSSVEREVGELGAPRLTNGRPDDASPSTRELLRASRERRRTDFRRRSTTDELSLRDQLSSLGVVILMLSLFLGTVMVLWWLFL